MAETTATDLTNVPFGAATITVGEGANAISFDGKTYFQSDGGEVVLTPQWQEIQFIDFGETIIDKKLTGWEGHVKVVAGQTDIKILQLALAATEAIIDSADPTKTVGLMDAKLGTSLRSKAQKVTIHPRYLPPDDKSLDITLYKVASDGDFTQTSANEQGKLEITLSLLPRDGMDADKPGNFFYVGPNDPNAAA